MNRQRHDNIRRVIERNWDIRPLSVHTEEREWKIDILAARLEEMLTAEDRLTAAADGADPEALSTLDLTVTRRLIASRRWIGGDLASALVDEVDRLTAALAAAGAGEAASAPPERCAWCERPATGTAAHSDGLRHPACAEHGLPGTNSASS